MIIIALDYLTGICKSYYNKDLSSYRSLKGIIKKVGECSLLAFVFILDEIMQSNGTLFTGYSYLVVASEGLSILENLGQMNIIVPNFIKERLLAIKETDKEKKK